MVGTSCSIVYGISGFRHRRSCVRCCSRLVLAGVGRRPFAAGRTRSPDAARSRHSSPAEPRSGDAGSGSGSARRRIRRRSDSGACARSAAGDTSIHHGIGPDITGITVLSGPAGVGVHHEQPAAGCADDHSGRDGVYAGFTTSCRTTADRSCHAGARDRTDHAAGAGAVSGHRQQQYQFAIGKSVSEYGILSRWSPVELDVELELELLGSFEQLWVFE